MPLNIRAIYRKRFWRHYHPDIIEFRHLDPAPFSAEHRVGWSDRYCNLAALYTVQRKLGGSRKLAITAMMIFLTAIFLLPIIFSAGMLSTLLENLLQWLMHLDKSHLPSLDFLTHIPLVGEHLHRKWLALMHENAESIFGTLKPWITNLL